MTPAELDALTESWITHMQAERKSPHTILHAHGRGRRVPPLVR